MGGGEGTLERIDERVTPVEAESLARECFGIDARAEALTGERDQNFRLLLSDGSKRVLKISNSAEDPVVTDLQTQALIHIAQLDPDLPTPRILRAPDGRTQVRWRSSSSRSVTIRLLTHLDGLPLYQLAVDGALLAEIGGVLGKLHKALVGFSHPGERHELLWDTQHAHRCREWLWALADADQRTLATEGLDIFQQRALPKLSSLPEQLIHNDFNPHNILVRPESRKISGILDLGDAVRAPRIIDVAVAAAYHLRSAGEMYDGVASMVEAYDRHQQLLDEEIGILIPLMIARLAMTVIITAWRAEHHPENRDYILKNAPLAWAGLRDLVSEDIDAASGRLLAKVRRLAA